MTTQSRPAEHLRLRSLDALRGLAASAVIFYHLWNRYFPDLSTQHQAWIKPAHASAFYCLAFPLQYGYLGVTLFFVLSGFCIHLPQALRHKNTGEDRLSIPTFARRRFFRIYPAYFASIVLTAALLGGPHLAAGIGRGHVSGLYNAFQIHDALLNATFLQFLNPNSLHFNGVYWTLVYEVQFYAFYPLLLLLSRRWGLLTMLVVLFAAEAACIVFPPAVPNLFIGRYFEWYLGMFGAEMIVQRSQSLRGVGILMSALLLGWATTFFPRLLPWRDLLCAVGFLGLLLAAVRAELHRPGSWMIPMIAPLAGIGLFSYSLYLIHVPIVDVCWDFSHLAHHKGHLSAVAANLLPVACIPISFACAYVWYRLFERPFMGARFTLRRRAGRSTAELVSAPQLLQAVKA